MKFRLRHLDTKNTTTIQIPSPSSLQDLKTSISNQLSLPLDSLKLSLNRKDELSSQPHETLQSLGLTSGDLIFYTLNPNGFSTSTSNQSQPQEVPPVQSEPTSQSSQVCDSHEFSEPTDYNFSTISEETMDIDVIDDVDESPMVKSCSVPSILKRVFSEEGNNTKGGHGSLIIAVHAIMLESGFVSFDYGTNRKIEGLGLPEGWFSNYVVNFRYTVPELEEPVPVVGIVTLKFMIQGDFVHVYGLVGEGSDTYRLSLRVSRFAPSIDYACNYEKDFFFIKDLGSTANSSHKKEVFELWKMVKDELSLRTLTVLCEKNRLVPPSSLMILPTDLKIKILEFLPGVDIAKVGCVCVELKYLSLNDDLWKKKIVEEFGDMDVMGPSETLSWKDKFAKLFRRSKKTVTETRMGDPFALPLFMRRLPRPRHPPGFPIIGGDFDRLPAIGDGPVFPFRRSGRRQRFGPPCNLGGAGYMGN